MKFCPSPGYTRNKRLTHSAGRSSFCHTSRNNIQTKTAVNQRMMTMSSCQRHGYGPNNGMVI